MNQKVDFHTVEPHQGAIHERLENWARWVTPGRQSWVAPMFRLYKAPPQWEPQAFRPTCDMLDAMLLEKAVYHLPDKHRAAVRWAYVHKGGPLHACRGLGLTSEGLYRHLRDGRQMLLNLLD